MAGSRGQHDRNIHHRLVRIDAQINTEVFELIGNGYEARVVRWLGLSEEIPGFFHEQKGFLILICENP